MNVFRRLLLTRKRRNPHMIHSAHMTKLSDEVTDILRKIVIFLLVAIVISQLGLQIPQVRLWVTGVDRLEGAPI